MSNDKMINAALTAIRAIEQQQEAIAGELVQGIVYGETKCDRCGELLVKGHSECVYFHEELEAWLMCLGCWSEDFAPQASTKVHVGGMGFIPF